MPNRREASFRCYIDFHVNYYNRLTPQKQLLVTSFYGIEGLGNCSLRFSESLKALCQVNVIYYKLIFIRSQGTNRVCKYFVNSWDYGGGVMSKTLEVNKELRPSVFTITGQMY